MTARANLHNGALLMAIAGIAFIGYGVLFLALNFLSSGFELGVSTINGVTRADLDAFEPGVLHYIGHLHVATSAFIISTGIAVTALSWFGVRRGESWAWNAAVASAVIGLLIALPMHWLDLFAHDWLVHLGPVYLAALVFLAGAGLSRRELGAGPIERGSEQRARASV